MLKISVRCGKCARLAQLEIVEREEGVADVRTRF